MTKNEFIKRSKVVDMMATMHSILGRRNKIKGQILDISILGSSILLVATVFIDPNFINSFGISPRYAKLTLGVASIGIFFLSIMSLVVDWKGKCSQHQEAFNALISLKSEYSLMLSSFDDRPASELSEFARRASLIASNLIPIPDFYFNSLKAMHYKKIELSKLISKNPGCSISFLRIKLFVESISKSTKSENNE